MIKIVKQLISWVFRVPVSMGMSVSYDNTSLDKETVKNATALPISNYSAKYKQQTETKNHIFEMVTIKMVNRGVSLVELRCVQTGEIISVDQAAFTLLFKKI